MSETEIVCPKCGSNQLSADKRGFSTGNAAKGLAIGLIGIPGGVLWGLKGKDKVIITCLKCGKQFKPGDGKTIIHAPITYTTPPYNPQLQAKLIAEEIEKQRRKEEAEQRKKEKEKAWWAKERELEKERNAEVKQKEKEYVASISIESAMKRKVSAANFRDLEIFSDKINKEIKRALQLKETPERKDEILKMNVRVNEIQSEIEAREKDIERKIARKQEKKELKTEFKKAEHELTAAQEILVKIKGFHLLRTHVQKEKQIQEQEKIIQDMQIKISAINEKLSEND